MWKLTLMQKRKSEYSDYMNEQKIEFFSEDLFELAITVERLINHTEVETEFKIERVKEGEGNEHH